MNQQPAGAVPDASIADALRGVTVVWVRRGEAPPDGAWRFSVRWLSPRPRSAALGFLESPLLFRGPAVRDEAPAVALFVTPSFDDLVALAMWAWERSGRGRAGGPAWEAVAHYADNVRQGLLPERVHPTRAPHAVFRAIAEQQLRGSRAGFVEPALWLVELLVAKVAAGKNLLGDDLVDGEPFLVEYLELLRDDERRYREDLERAHRYRARIPAEAAGGAQVTLPLIAIASPRATHFRVWAQRDPQAPGGAGWPLIVLQRRPVEPGLSDVQITAMPTAKVTVSFLAPPLTAAERRAAGAEAEPWYAGADYADRMVASPEEGTRLSFREVLEAISRPLQLSRLAPRWARFSVAGALVAVVAAAVTLTMRPALFQRGVQRVAPTPDPPGLEQRREAFRGRKDRALLVATDRYDDPRWRALRYPVKQAGELAAALERRGFAVTRLDDPTFGEVRAALKKSKDEEWKPYDQLVVYFAGHGAMFDDLGTGQLVLRDSRGEHGGYLSLAELRQSLVEHAARHVLLVLDSCYAGAFAFDPRRDLRGRDVAYRGERAAIDEAAAMEKLSVPTRRYLAAVGRDVTPDTSQFSAELIAFLASGAAHYSSDLSLAARLEGVTPSPRYGRFEGDEEAGAFLFRPAAPAPP